MNEEEAIAKALKDRGLNSDKPITVIVKKDNKGCLLILLFFFFIFLAAMVDSQ